MLIKVKIHPISSTQTLSGVYIPLENPYVSQVKRSCPWGTTEIRFFTNEFSEREVADAARQVATKFDTPKDMFVSLTTDTGYAVAGVPDKPKPRIFSSRDKERLVAILKQISEFLDSMALLAHLVGYPLPELLKPSPEKLN